MTNMALAVALLLCSSATVAHAQFWAVSARTTGVSGASDNILNAADSTDPAIPGPLSDIFYQIQPSVSADYASPRTLHQFTYAFDAFFYQENTNANSTSHRAAWQSRWILGPRSELLVEASADMGQANTFLVEAQPESGAVELIPRGDLDFRRLSLVQRFRWRATPTLRLGQEYTMSTFSTSVAGEPQTSGTELVAQIGADRLWKRDAVGAQVALSLLDLHRLSTVASPVSQSQTEVNLAVLSRWRRELSPRWISTVSAGVTVTSGPSPTVTDRLRPIADAELAYTRRWGGAALNYGRAVEPNLSIAQKTVTDRGRLRGWLPLPWLRRNPAMATLNLTSSTALERGTGIELETGESTGSWTTFLFDIALTWAATDKLEVGLRYQHSTQNSDSMTVLGYSRNLASISVSGELGVTRQVRHRLRTRASEGATEPGSFAEQD